VTADHCRPHLYKKRKGGPATAKAVSLPRHPTPDAVGGALLNCPDTAQQPAQPTPPAPRTANTLERSETAAAA